MLPHVAAPAAISALAALTWIALLLQAGEPTFRRASGLTTDVYLGRWLALSAGLFACSALVYAVRRRAGASPDS